MGRVVAIAVWGLLSSVPFALARAQSEPPIDAGVAPDASAPDTAPDAAVPARSAPPVLTQFIEAVYPPAAQAVGHEAAVELLITISATGAVTDAQVVTPVGEGFDEAAVAAARWFVFEPARSRGQPAASRIRYRYVFELRPAPVEAEPVVEVPTVGQLKGRVRATDGGGPIAEAEVLVTSVETQEARRVVTASDGRFELADLAPGSYRVRVTAPDYLSFESTEEVRVGEITDAAYRLAVKEDVETFRAVARVDPPPREVTRRTIEREELTRIAGTRGDALRTVEILPGVARPPMGAGALLIRGSSPRDSQVFLDGQGVPLLYHFGGLTSFINSRVLDRIDFYPGGFSARYGRKLGGIIDVATRDPASDRLQAEADVNLIDSSFIVEGPVAENVSIAAAARRSYVDTFFEYVVPSSLFDVVAAPVYYDYQLFVAYRPTTRDRLRLMLYGSSDEFRIVFAEPTAGDPAIRGNLDFQTSFHRAQVEWRRRFSAAFEQELSFATGTTGLLFGLGPEVRFELDIVPVLGRAEWRYRFGNRARLIAGMDIEVGRYDIQYRGPQPGQNEGTPQQEPLSGRDTLTFGQSATAYRPAAYVEADLRPFDPWQVVLGFRADWFREIGSWALNPRLSTRYRLDSATNIKGGVGLFSQPPEFHESSREIGNSDLDPVRAVHVGAGVERTIAEGVSVGLEGFYKWLDDRVVGTQGGVAPFFTNDGVGRIYGLELSGHIRPRGRFFGYLSYTLSRSQRRDHPGDAWRLFDFDQTHILTLSSVYRLGRGWEAGATFRLVTGNPDTPVIGSIYDADFDVYQPIYGGINAARNPYFHRLDVRVEKKWRFQLWSLAAYLDVQNVYNATNREGVIHGFDFSETTDLPGLPILPSIGVRGEL